MPAVKAEDAKVVSGAHIRRKAAKPLDEEAKSIPRATRATKADTSLAWGRNLAPSAAALAGCAAIVLFCPVLVFVFWAACDAYKGSLTKLLTNWPVILNHIPKPTSRGFLLYGGWVAFQAALYNWLPSKVSQGQTTPAGHLLAYKTNGLKAWGISHLAFLCGALRYNLFSPAIIHDNWGALLIATNVYGYLLAGFCYIKAHLAPSHAEDRKFSGSRLYDFYMGIEFNPRFGELWDFKLFHNGRPGIIGWTMINASMAFAQYHKHGYITNSMFLVNILQAVYVLDFFIHEDWYLRTIDIAHDHFGFMLAWGDSVWLPFMYTLQARYLVDNPVVLPEIQLWATFALGMAGYLVFRYANDQKDTLRKSGGDCTIWDKPAKFIRAKYTSADNEEHESLLLCSGFWGLSRHFNYLGDLMLSGAMCLACGFNHALPYFYIVYMGILLLHRISRDHSRCLGKYGSAWDEYCRRVPYKLIPWVF